MGVCVGGRYVMLRAAVPSGPTAGLSAQARPPSSRVPEHPHQRPQEEDGGEEAGGPGFRLTREAEGHQAVWLQTGAPCIRR